MNVCRSNERAISQLVLKMSKFVSAPTLSRSARHSMSNCWPWRGKKMLSSLSYEKRVK
jgi:hypothetical protein